MPTATNTNSTSTRLQRCFYQLSDHSPRLAAASRFDRSTRSVAGYRCATRITVGRPSRRTRKTLLDHAHELIDLMGRSEDRRGRYRGKPRRISCFATRTWTWTRWARPRTRLSRGRSDPPTTRCRAVSQGEPFCCFNPYPTCHLRVTWGITQVMPAVGVAHGCFATDRRAF
jgi:hypothetical protein